MRSRFTLEDGWRGFSWRPATLALIKRRVDRHRGPLAQALGLNDTTEIDAAVGDVATLLIRCAAFLREVDRAASPARQRIVLRRFCETGQFTGAALWRLDGATFNLIAKHYPRGSIALNTDPIDPQDLRTAVDAAIEDQGSPRRGRSAQTDSLALRQLALGLAHIYHTQTGHMPTRRYDPYRMVEYGPFRNFAGAVIDLLPPVFRSYQAGGHRGVDHLVRLAIVEYKAGLKEPNVARRWTIDESLWLGSEPLD